MAHLINWRLRLVSTVIENNTGRSRFPQATGHGTLASALHVRITNLRGAFCCLRREIAQCNYQVSLNSFGEMPRRIYLEAFPVSGCRERKPGNFS